MLPYSCGRSPSMRQPGGFAGRQGGRAAQVQSLVLANMKVLWNGVLESAA